MYRAGPFHDAAGAVAAARGVASQTVPAAPGAALEVIGEFVIPPLDAPRQRDFQTLHFDFGLPLAPGRPVDVARCTALFMSPDRPSSGAVTRFVALDVLLSQRAWPAPEVLRDRFARYGATHGAWEPAAGYVEGSLARLVEAATGDPPVLPSVRADPTFLCGHEFTELAAETAFFAHRGLDLAPAQSEIALEPGDLLVFDNLHFAHGRRGVRHPGELHQVVLGHRALERTAQAGVRDVVLRAFAAGSPEPSEPFR